MCIARLGESGWTLSVRKSKLHKANTQNEGRERENRRRRKGREHLRPANKEALPLLLQPVCLTPSNTLAVTKIVRLFIEILSGVRNSFGTVRFCSEEVHKNTEERPRTTCNPHWHKRHRLCTTKWMHYLTPDHLRHTQYYNGSTMEKVILRNIDS